MTTHHHIIRLSRWFATVAAMLLLGLSSRAAAAALPSIYAFNVAAEATINLGTTTSLNWSVGGTIKLTLTPVGDVTGKTSVAISPTTTTTYVLTATNAAGSVTKSKTITVIVPPTIKSLTATPAQIASGASTTLAWSATGASYYQVSADVGSSPGTTTATSVTVKPKANTTYTVTAVNPAGTVAQSVAVQVTAPVAKPTIDAFTASPATVLPGGSATLAWSTTGASTVTLSPDVGPLVGSTAPVSPATTTAYTLTATNSSGSVTKKVTVTVSAGPQIGRFSASPSTIASGASTTLTWSIAGATSVTISPGVGAVTGTSVSVSPTATTTYTLKATNASGTSSQTTAVVVSGSLKPLIASFVATPTFVQAGAGSTLAWSASGADTLVLTADSGVSPGTVTGTSLVVQPQATTTYTLTATNRFGTASATAIVTLYNVTSGSSVTHPRIWVTPASAAALAQRALAGDAAWLKLRSDCDAYVTMTVSFPDQDPSSNTINGGYEFNDYLLPAEELGLGYLTAKTADPARAAKYAVKERQLLLALSDPVHHGRPTTDSGYSIRSYVPALALGYDWIYDTLNDSDRAQIYTEINRWVASFDQSGFGRDFPQGNYFAGYYCAKALGALATEGDNPNAAALWNDWLNRLHLGMVQPYYQTWLSGGGAPDGWNYGPFETINMMRPIAAAMTAKGLDLMHGATPFAYGDGHARWMTQFTWPDLTTVSDRGFVYDGDNPTEADAGWATQFNGLLHLANGDNAPLMQAYTKDLRALHGTGGVEPWAEFLLQDANAPIRDYRTDLSLRTVGDGQVAMRSSWATDAVWASFQAGPYTGYDESSEELFDEGSLAIQRGNIQFLVNPWGALMRDTPGTDDGSTGDLFSSIYNELFSDQTDGVHSGRRIFNTYYAVRAGGYWGQVGAGPDDSKTTLSVFEDTTAHVLMRGTRLESQYLDGSPITGWTRTVAYLRPQLFIVYDRTTLNSAAADNWMAWHVAAAPTEQAGAAPGTHRFDVVDSRAAFGGNLFRGRVSTVLPLANQVTTVDTFGRGKVYRLEVRPAAAAASATWLSVFDASASAASASTVSALTAGNGTVLAGAMEGAAIAKPDGTQAVVLFSQTGQPVTATVSVAVPTAATALLVVDLAPGAGYDLQASVAGSTLTLKLVPGGSYVSTAQGTIAATISTAGAITQQ